MNALFGTLDRPYEDELRAFGSNWCGPESYEIHKETLVARYESDICSDGQTVEVYCVAMPARFYIIRALAGANSVGDPLGGHYTLNSAAGPLGGC